jgi:hypothetical protein
MVADDVFVDAVAFLLGADEDGNDLALSCYAIRFISKCDKYSSASKLRTRV